MTPIVIRDRFQIPVDVVAAQFAERNDAFFKISSEKLKSKLNILLNYDVDPATILNCKNTFRTSDAKIKRLLLKMKEAGINNKISSWMICSQKIDR